MPTTETVLRIFVASPSDVADERDLLEEVVREMNLAWSDALGVRLDLLQWTTHVAPGLGDDAQSVINAQIGDNFDLFICVFWTRFGSATARAGSGTEEEFNRALARARQRPGSVELIVYFKDQPIAPSKLIGSDIDKVQAFRERVAREGCVYSVFEDGARFQSLLRIHLAKFIQSRLKSIGGSGDDRRHADVREVPSNILEETGVLELLESFQRHMDSVGTAGQPILLAVDHLAARMSKDLIVNEQLKRDGAWNTDTRRLQANRLAANFSRFSDDFEIAYPVLVREFREGYSDLGRAVTRLVELRRYNLSSLPNVLNFIREKQQALTASAELMTTWRASIAVIPRVTSELRHETSRAMELINGFVRDFGANISILRDAEIVIATVLDTPAPSG